MFNSEKLDISREIIKTKYDDFYAEILCSNLEQFGQLQPRGQTWPVFANKALLKHNHAYEFMCCLWLFLCYTMAEFSNCNKDYIACQI